MENNLMVEKIDLNADSRKLLKILRAIYTSEVNEFKDSAWKERLIGQFPDPIKKDILSKLPANNQIHFLIRTLLAGIIREKILSDSFQGEVCGYISLYLLLEEARATFPLVFTGCKRGEDVFVEDLQQLLNDYPLQNEMSEITTIVIKSRLIQIYNIAQVSAKRYYRKSIKLLLAIILDLTTGEPLPKDVIDIKDTIEEHVVNLELPVWYVDRHRPNLRNILERIRKYVYRPYLEKFDASGGTGWLVARKIIIAGSYNKYPPEYLQKLIANHDKCLLIAETSDGITTTLDAIARISPLSSDEEPGTNNLYFSAFDFLPNMKESSPLTVCVEDLLIHHVAMLKYQLLPGLLSDQLTQEINSGHIRLLVDDFYRLSRADRIRLSNYLLQCPKVLLTISDGIGENNNEMAEITYGWNNEPRVLRLMGLDNEEILDFFRAPSDPMRYLQSNYVSEPDYTYFQNKYGDVGFQPQTMTEIMATKLASRSFLRLGPAYRILADQMNNAGLGALIFGGDKIPLSKAERMVYALGESVNWQINNPTAFGKSEPEILFDLDILKEFITEQKIRQYLKSLVFTHDERRVKFRAYYFYVFVWVVYMYYKSQRTRPNLFRKLFGGFWGEIQWNSLSISNEIRFIGSLRGGESGYFGKTSVASNKRLQREVELEQMMKRFGESQYP